MSLILCYDAETTGLPNWKEPSESPDQPHMVQLAARLVDGSSRAILSTLDVVIRPDGWEIPAEVSAIHGITTERALEIGVSESLALNLLLAMWQTGATRLAFNRQFDDRIVRIGMKRYGYSDEDCDAFKAAPGECAMRIAQNVMGGRQPNLSAAHEALCGAPHPQAHSALADVDACLAVYWAAVERVTQAA